MRVPGSQWRATTHAGCLAEDEKKVGFVDVDTKVASWLQEGVALDRGAGWRQKSGLGVTCVKGVKNTRAVSA